MKKQLTKPGALDLQPAWPWRLQLIQGYFFLGPYIRQRKIDSEKAIYSSHLFIFIFKGKYKCFAYASQGQSNIDFKEKKRKSKLRHRRSQLFKFHDPRATRWAKPTELRVVQEKLLRKRGTWLLRQQSRTTLPSHFIKK